jgi:hypothetical protein
MRRLFTSITPCDGLYFDSTILFSQWRSFETLCPTCLQIAALVVLRYERIYVASRILCAFSPWTRILSPEKFISLLVLRLKLHMQLSRLACMSRGYSRESRRLNRLYSQLDRNSPNVCRSKSRFEKKFYVFFEIIN